MSVSNDGGRTFSEPVDGGGDYKGSIQSPRLVVGQRGELMVFFEESAGFGGQQKLPGLSIAPDGRIDVAWYDSREDPTARVNAERHLPLQHVYYSYSLDGGRTWVPNVRVSDRLIDRNIGVWETGIRSPVALVSDRHVLNIAWVDARNGDPATDNEDIYFARARFGDPAEAFGGATSTTTHRGWWFVLLLAVALAFAGGAFLVGARIGNRPQAERSGTSSPSPSAP